MHVRLAFARDVRAWEGRAVERRCMRLIGD